MLESALPVVGMNPQSIGDYVTNATDYKLIKLHGSTNWGREVEDPPISMAGLSDWQAVRVLIANAARIRVGKYHLAYQHPVWRHPTDSNRALFPAIAIPIETKKNYECPDDHVQLLERCIQETRKLLIVGWSAGDAPLVATLAAALPQPARVLVAAGDPGRAAQVVERLKKAQVQSHLTPWRGGFTDLILSHEAEDFLKAEP
jgi:hypothetical protein